MKSRIFSIIIVFLFLGVAFSEYLELGRIEAISLSLIFLISSFLVLRNKIYFTLILSLSFFIFGTMLSQLQSNKYLELNSKYSEKEFEIIAVVDEIPAKNEFGLSAILETKNIGKEAAEHRVIGYFRESVEYGEIIKFKGKMPKYQDEKIGYMVKQKLIGQIYVNKYETVGKKEKATLKNKLYNFRIKVNEVIYKSLPTDEANLASGLILGEKALFSAETKRLLQAAGVSHIIALSGYNITILLGLFASIKNRFSRNVNLIVPLLFIIFFVLMTGGSASIVRAGIMGFMPILAKYLYRPKSTFIAILFSAFLMVLANPFILLHDIGFQLSFAAMFGLCYITPVIQSWLKDNYIYSLLSETLGAQLAVLPLLIYYFGNVSLISPISNLIILSLVPIGMLVSFLVGMFGFINIYLGYLVATPSFVILKIINLLIGFFGNLGFSSFQFLITNPAWIFVMYLALFNIFFVWFRRSKNV